MINILKFKKYIEELAQISNANCNNKIDNVIIGVNEDHISKVLSTKRGISLCASFPDASGDGEDVNNKKDSNHSILFICEKIDVGSQTYEAQIKCYERMQDIMLSIRSIIIQKGDEDGLIVPDLKNKIEWEYQIFSGYNGLSLGLNFEDYDRTTY